MKENEKSASQQIDDIVRMHSGWKGDTLAQLREILHQVHPALTEEVKWKKPSKPEGVPVWAYHGNVCVADTLKNAVRLTFPKGAQISDPKSIFNTRMDSKTVRAIEFYEDSTIDSPGIQEIVTKAITLNTSS